MKLGAHESISGGLHKALERAQSAGCEVLQLFVKSSRSWHLKPLSGGEISLFKQKVLETGIQPVAVHSCYLINLATPETSLWKRSIETMIVELERCEMLGIPNFIVHPGSHMGMGEKVGLERIAEALGEIQRATSGSKVKILLESTAGQGTALGYRFEHLAWIMENTHYGDSIGICLDTCHIFASGYDIRTEEAYEATMDEFNRIIGFDHLHVLHLNDSKGKIGSRIDRHEHIGKGEVGLEAFRLILSDPRFPEDLPGLLETPKGEDLHEDRENLAILRLLKSSAEKN